MSSYQWLILLSTFACLSVQAGGEGSGGTVFKKLNPQDAFKSKLYDKVIERKILPESSTFYNPAYELCQENKMVRTSQVKEMCTFWKVTIRNSFNKIETFGSLYEAKQFAESDGKGSPYCDVEDIVPTVYASAADRVKLSFRVDYYLKSKEQVISNYVGSHTYVIAPCDHELINVSGIDWVIYGQ